MMNKNIAKFKVTGIKSMQSITLSMTRIQEHNIIYFHNA